MGVITRAEEFYLPPPILDPTTWDDAAPAERVIRWTEHHQQRRITTDPTAQAGELYARINHSRWVADCTCGSAQIVTPADPRMWCVVCGAGWWQLIFPADVDVVEESLAALPIIERNWWATADPVFPALEV